MSRLTLDRAKLLGSGLDLHATAVAGAAAETDIAVAGLKPSDELLVVLDATFTDQTPDASIQANGALQLTADTAATRLLVVWFSG